MRSAALSSARDAGPEALQQRLADGQRTEGPVLRRQRRIRRVRDGAHRRQRRRQLGADGQRHAGACLEFGGLVADHRRAGEKGGRRLVAAGPGGAAEQLRVEGAALAAQRRLGRGQVGVGQACSHSLLAGSGQQGRQVDPLARQGIEDGSQGTVGADGRHRLCLRRRYCRPDRQQRRRQHEPHGNGGVTAPLRKTLHASGSSQPGQG
jgi:hypothetical protein